MTKEEMYLVLENVTLNGKDHYDEIRIPIDLITDVEKNHDRMVDMYLEDAGFKSWLDDIIVDVARDNDD